MLYIHIPFCKKKCIYCNFYSGGNPDWERYLKAVASELIQRIEELRGDSLTSIYIGGGTPSLIPKGFFAPFMNSLWSTLIKSNIQIASDIEVTLEVNPEDVTRESSRNWALQGINRISMGIQTLNDTELSYLNRRHSAQKAIEAVEILKNDFNNINLDIIYGIPGQTKESLSETLTKLISLNPNHLSAYSLTYEAGTPLELLRQRGKVKECPEELYLQYDNIVASTLKENGYIRYEISNYAKPGFESRHNSGYWTSKSYLGIGPSASSYNGLDIRRNNPPDLYKYIAHFTNDTPCHNPFYIEEKLTELERMEERIFLSLRTKNGLNLDDFSNEFGYVASAELLKKAERWLGDGSLKLKDNRLALSKKGISISDHIILELI